MVARVCECVVRGGWGVYNKMPRSHTSTISTSNIAQDTTPPCGRFVKACCSTTTGCQNQITRFLNKFYTTTFQSSHFRHRNRSCCQSYRVFLKMGPGVCGISCNLHHVRCQSLLRRRAPTLTILLLCQRVAKSRKGRFRKDLAKSIPCT